MYMALRITINPYMYMAVALTTMIDVNRIGGERRQPYRYTEDRCLLTAWGERRKPIRICIWQMIWCMGMLYVCRIYIWQDLTVYIYGKGGTPLLDSNRGNRASRQPCFTRKNNDDPYGYTDCPKRNAASCLPYRQYKCRMRIVLHGKQQWHLRPRTLPSREHYKY